MCWLASDTCAPAPKFCRYAVYAATVPVFSASAQAFSSASLRVCLSAACCCCCAAVCCESEGWLQADIRAAPAMTATTASFRNAIRPAHPGCCRKSPVMAGPFRVYARPPLLVQRRRASSVQYVPKLRRGQRLVARPPRLPAPTTRRRRRRFQGALPDRSVIELNGHAVRGIDRAEIGPGNPQAARVIHPASGWLADLVD